MNSKLIEQAIADAKRIQKIALQDAKRKLSQAFTPRIKSMLSDKINAIQSEDQVQEGLQESKQQVDQLGDPNDQEDIAESSYQDDQIDLNQIVKNFDQQDDQMIQQKKKVDQPKDQQIPQDDQQIPQDDQQVSLDVQDGEIQTPKEQFNDDDDVDIDITDDQEPMNDDDQDLDFDIEDDIPQEDDKLSDVIDDDDVNIDIDDSDIDINIEDDEQCAPCQDNQQISFEDDDQNTKEDDQLKFAQKEIRKLQQQNKQLKLNNKKLIKQNKTYEQAVEYLKYKMDQTQLANHKIGLVVKLFQSKTLTQQQKNSIIDSFDKATNKKQANLIFQALNTKTKKMVKQGTGSSPIRSTKPINTNIIKQSVSNDNP